jgi:multiple sugar transport system ATP-binding protein
MEVELVEPLGSEIYVHGRVGGRRVVARLGPERTVEAGEKLRLAPDPAHLHFFDAATGLALRPSTAGVAP